MNGTGSKLGFLAAANNSAPSAVGLPSLGDVSGDNPALHVFAIAVGS